MHRQWGEYINQHLHDYCSAAGIVLELTVPHTSQQNGVAERANMTLTERMHAMMKDRECPIAFWGEAIHTTTYCLNRTASSANGGITLLEAFDSEKPDISHLQTFYCDAYIHCTESQGAKKLGDWASLVKFIGYPDGVSGYKFWDPVTCTMKISCSVQFLDDAASPSLPPVCPDSPDTSASEVDVRNPVLSRSDEPPTSFGGAGSFRSGPTRVGMRPMMRIGEYV